MKIIVAGIVVILVGYAWLVLNAYVGYTNAWWWFSWSEYKPLFGAFHLAGAILIGLGIQRRRKKAKSQIAS